MSPELAVLQHLIRLVHARWQALRADPEAGYSTETVVVTALLVLMAVAALAIISAKVLGSANNINTSGN